MAEGTRESPWFRAAEQFKDELDEARVELAACKQQAAEKEAAHIAEVQALESRLLAVEARGNAVVAAARGIVNAPLTPRDEVQSRLLLALQRFDRK